MPGAPPRFNRFLEHAVTVAITAIVGAVVSYFVFRPDAHAQFFCKPYEGSAPLAIECINESLYAREIIWDFGDGTQSSRNSDRITHEYSTARDKPYVIKLTALGKSRHENSREIVVHAATKILVPQRVTIAALRPSAIERTTKSCTISFVNDDHRSTFSESTREFTETCAADPGFNVVEAQFIPTSQTRASGPHIDVRPDDKTVLVSSRITAGPGIDRYRGWLHGRLEITQQRENQAPSLELAANLPVSHYGLYQLDKSLTFDSVNAFVFETASGTKATVRPGQTFIDPRSDVAYSVLEQSGNLYLDVRETAPH